MAPRLDQLSNFKPCGPAWVKYLNALKHKYDNFTNENTARNYNFDFATGLLFGILGSEVSCHNAISLLTA